MMDKTKKGNQATITVSGVTFSANQVKSATVTIDGRDVYIGEKETSRTMGFPGQNEHASKEDAS